MTAHEDEEQIIASKASQRIEKPPERIIASRLNQGRSNFTSNVSLVEDRIEEQVIDSRSSKVSSQIAPHAPGNVQRIQTHPQNVSIPSPAEEEEEEETVDSVQSSQVRTKNLLYSHPNTTRKEVSSVVKRYY